MAKQGTFDVQVNDGMITLTTDSGDAITRTTTKKDKQGNSSKVETGVVAYTPKAQWGASEIENAPIVEVDGQLTRLRKLSVVAEVWTPEAIAKADKAAQAKRGRAVVAELRKQDVGAVLAYIEGKATVKGLRYEQLPQETKEKVEALAQQKSGKAEKAKPLTLAQLADAILALEEAGEDTADLKAQMKELREKQKANIAKANEGKAKKAEGPKPTVEKALEAKAALIKQATK